MIRGGGGGGVLKGVLKVTDTSRAVSTASTWKCPLTALDTDFPLSVIMGAELGATASAGTCPSPDPAISLPILATKLITV